MAGEMTEQEAQKLFNEVSKTFKDDDSTKLTELMKEPEASTEVIPDKEEIVKAVRLPMPGPCSPLATGGRLLAPSAWQWPKARCSFGFGAS